NDQNRIGGRVCRGDRLAQAAIGITCAVIRVSDFRYRQGLGRHIEQSVGVKPNQILSSLTANCRKLPSNQDFLIRLDEYPGATKKLTTEIRVNVLKGGVKCSVGIKSCQALSILSGNV